MLGSISEVAAIRIDSEQLSAPLIPLQVAHNPRFQAMPGNFYT